MMDVRTVSRLAIAGTVLILLGLLTGLVTGVMTDPRLGLSAHLEGLMNGILLIAIAGIWRRRVKLGRRAEQWTVNLLLFSSYANWFTTLLAAMWGTSRLTPIAGSVRVAQPWQEDVVMLMLVTLSITMIGGIVLLIRGLVNAKAV